MAARKTSLADVTSRLLALDPDIVLLQEVDQNVPRSGNVDEPRELGAALSAQALFLPAIELDGGRYGIAVLSTLQITMQEPIQLTNVAAAEPRVALRATVCVEAACFDVINHHADYVLVAARESSLEVLDAARPSIGKGIVVAGDFNQVPSDAGPRAYAEAGLLDIVAASKFDGPTFKDRRIDFEFMDGRLMPCVLRSGVTVAPESDHNAVVVDVDPAPCLE